MRPTLLAIAALTLSTLYAQSPTIPSTTPAKNALNVPLDATISATFDLNMDAATINDTTFIVHGSYTASSVEPSSMITARRSPHSPLPAPSGWVSR